MSLAGSSLLPDAPARREAAQGRDANFVVLAGAGTGKTSLLVERVLAALGEGRIQVDQIAAITFTRKAAGELKVRLAHGLESLRALGRQTGEPSEQDGAAGRAYAFLTGEQGHSPGQVAGRALRSLERLDRLTVSTIHAFCDDLLRAHPVEAGVDPRFVLDEGDRRLRLFQEEWDAFRAAELGPAASRIPLWHRLLSRVPLRLIREAALALASLEAPARAARVAPPDLRRLLAGELQRLDGDLTELQRRLAEMTTATRGLLESLTRVVRAMTRGGREAMLEALRSEPDLARRLDRSAPRPSKKGDAAFSSLMQKVFREGFALLRAVRRVDEELFEDLLETVAPFARAARERALSRGLVGFHDLLLLTRDLLRDHPRVRNGIKQRYRMLLVDEFQDTDPLQYEIIFYITEEIEAAHADPFTAPLAPGRLFIVGDPKQSIYRFRGADHHAFQRATERIVAVGGRSLSLSANFRSRPGIIEAVNILFAPGSPASGWAASSSQPPYALLHAARPAASGSPDVELWTIQCAGEKSAALRRQAEGRVLAREIAWLVHEKKTFHYGDITVLFRATGNLSFYLQPLREAGIRFVVDGGREFLGRTEVTQFLALLRCLAQPGDAAAFLGFLRSPAGAVPDTELAAYAATGASWEWPADLSISPASFPNLARAVDHLRRMAQAIRALPADRAIRHVLTHSRILPLSACAHDGAQQVANLQKLADLGQELTRDGSLPLAEVLDLLEQRQGGLQEADSPLADEATDAVKVMTIHKAKGLQNRVVILPDLARESRPPAPRETASVARPTLPHGAPAYALGMGAPVERMNGVRVWYELTQAREQSAEEMRVFYVALTRAQDRLVLMAGPPRGNTPWLDALRAWDYRWAPPPAHGALLAGGRVLHRLFPPAAAWRREAPPEGSRQMAPAAATYARALEILHASRTPPLRAPSTLEVPHDKQAGDRSREPIPAAHRQGAREAGLWMHRLLQTWSGTDPGELLQAGETAARALAGETGLPAARILAMGRPVLDAFLASPLAAHFTAVHRLGREVPVLVQTEDGAHWRGRIDLLYQDRDRSLVVADYKTDLDEDARRLRRRYGPQLRLYARAVDRAFGRSRPVRAELWMLRSGRRIPI